MTDKVKQIAVVMPVYNDWPSFALIVAEISERFSGGDITFQLYAVDDASIAPFDLASIEVRSDSCIASIECIHLVANMGHQRAIAIGLCVIAKLTDIDAAVVMDCDGEDRPRDIAALLEASQRHPGHVVFARRTRRSEKLQFRFWYWFYKLIFRVLTGQTISFGNFSLIPISALRRLVYMPDLWNHLAGCILRSRLLHVAISSERGSRYAGESKMNFISLAVHGLSAMSVYTDVIFVRVLLISVIIGAGSVIIAASGMIIRFLTDLATPGWATTLVGNAIIMFLLAMLIGLASALTILSGRTNRPIIPIRDTLAYVERRKRRQFRPNGIVGRYPGGES
jgi:hypothetical protein